MDPVSIAASCTGIMAFVANTSTGISAFVRNVRDARQDLAVTSGQLAELTIVLDLLGAEHEQHASSASSSWTPANGPGAQRTVGIPQSIQDQILSILNNCREILRDINALLESYWTGPLRSVQWAAKGKDEVAGFNKQLNTHLRALNLALDVSTVAIVARVQDDTVHIRDDTSSIRRHTNVLMGDTDRIFVEIAELRALLADAAMADHSPRQHGVVMHRCFQSVAEYAESVFGDGANGNDASAGPSMRPQMRPQMPPQYSAVADHAAPYSPRSEVRGWFILDGIRTCFICGNDWHDWHESHGCPASKSLPYPPHSAAHSANPSKLIVVDTTKMRPDVALAADWTTDSKSVVIPYESGIVTIPVPAGTIRSPATPYTSIEGRRGRVRYLPQSGTGPLVLAVREPSDALGQSEVLLACFGGETKLVDCSTPSNTITRLAFGGEGTALALLRPGWIEVLCWDWRELEYRKVTDIAPRHLDPRAAVFDLETLALSAACWEKGSTPVTIYTYQPGTAKPPVQTALTPYAREASVRYQDMAALPGGPIFVTCDPKVSSIVVDFWDFRSAAKAGWFSFTAPPPKDGAVLPSEEERVFSVRYHAQTTVVAWHRRILARRSWVIDIVAFRDVRDAGKRAQRHVCRLEAPGRLLCSPRISPDLRYILLHSFPADVENPIESALEIWSLPEINWP